MRDPDEVKVFLYLSTGKSKLAYRETRTWTREKPGLDTRTYLRKKPDLSPQNPDSIKKTEFKTGLIKKHGFKSVAYQSVICLYIPYP